MVPKRENGRNDDQGQMIQMNIKTKLIVSFASMAMSMARQLNLEMVAEGVENEEQMTFLEKHGCTEIQGYYLSKPLPADAFTAFLDKQTSTS